MSSDAGSKEIVTLNDGLVNEFSIEELESRLETDPLMLSQIFGIAMQDNDGSPIERGCIGKCPRLTTCHEYIVSCDHTGGCSPICSGFEV